MTLILDATDGTLPAETEARFVDLYAASVFFRTALFTGDDLELGPLADAVTLTDRGEERVEALAEAGFDVVEATAGLFASFYWDDFFVDVEATDPGEVASIVGGLMTGGGLALPWLFGRDLHDRYSATHISDHFALDEDETATLLAETPAGVFQTGRLVSGPFGLLRSRERRLFSPNAVGPGVSCSDPGCERLHTVTLDSKEHPAYDAYEWLDEPDNNEAPLVRGLHGAFETACGLESRHMDDANPATLPLLLANAFSGEERCAILEALVEADDTLPGDWPSALAESVGGDERSVRITGIGDAESLQLCLTASDAALVAAVDAALAGGRLVIPAREIRTPVLSGVRIDHGYFDVQSEVSALGVRFRSRRLNVATLRLTRLLGALTEDADGRAAFLAVTPGPHDARRGSVDAAPGTRSDAEPSTPDHAFDDHLRAAALEADPRAMVADFVLGDPSRAAAACRTLGLPAPGGAEHTVQVAGDASRLADRMLWKLGFRIPMQESPVAAFWTALEHAEHAIPAEGAPEPGPDALDAIRAAAMLLLPVTAQVLEHALSFSTWALLTDHVRAGEFGRFEYDADAARAVTVSTLNGRLIDDGGLPAFNADGPTDLDAVVAGFSGLARVARGLLDGDRAGLAYGPDQLPKWAGANALFSFPFRHRYPVLDLDRTAAHALCDTFDAATRTLSEARTALIMARLAQPTGEPPSAGEVREAWRGLRAVVEGLEAVGACPSVYIATEERMDAYGRGLVRLTDYRGDVVTLHEVHALDLAGLPLEAASQLVFHGARLAGSGLALRFRFNEASTYTARWRNYAPKRIGPPRADAAGHEDAPGGGGEGRVEHDDSLAGDPRADDPRGDGTRRDAADDPHGPDAADG